MWRSFLGELAAWVSSWWAGSVGLCVCVCVCYGCGGFFQDALCVTINSKISVVAHVGEKKTKLSLVCGDFQYRMHGFPFLSRMHVAPI